MQILLVIVLGIVERRCRSDFCGNSALVACGGHCCLKTLKAGLCGGGLFRR